MKVHQTDFGSGSVAKGILDVALLITLAQILNLFYNIVDRIYIGHIPEIGDLALTGVGLCFPLITLIMAFGMLFGSNGGAPLCSVYMGKGDNEEAEKIMGTSFSLLLLTGFLITAIGLIFSKSILYTFGASEITYGYAHDYLIIYLLGSIAVTITLGMTPFINSQGFGRTGMMTVVIGATLNIILDPIFIFGFFLMALHSTGQNTFVALCMAKEATFYSLLRKVIIVIPLTIMLPHLWNLGVQGVFLAEPISNVIGGLACYLAMRYKVKVELDEHISSKKCIF